MSDKDTYGTARVAPPTETEAIDLWRQTMRRCGGDGVAAAKLLAKAEPLVFRVLEKSRYSFEDLCGLDEVMGQNLQGDGEFF